MIFFQIILVTLFLSIQCQSNSTFSNIDKCMNGCVQCDKTQSESVCKQCDKGYSLDLQYGFCINTQCDKNLILQKYEVENKCVAVCEPPNIANSQIQQCIKIEECSKSYITKETINTRISLRDLIVISEEYLLLLYDSFYNLVMRETGKIMKTGSLKIDIIKLTSFLDTVFSISTPQSIYEYDAITEKYTLIGVIKLGVFNQKSDILFSQDGIACIQSFNESLLETYITPIFSYSQQGRKNLVSEVKPLTINIGQTNIQILKRKYLVQLSKNIISIGVLKVNTKQQIINVEIQNLVNNLQCNGLEGQQDTYTTQEIIQLSNQNIILVIKLQPYLFLIDLQTQSCKSLKTQQNPIKIMTISSQKYNQELTVVSFLSQLAIYSHDLDQFFIKSDMPNIIDYEVQNQLNNFSKVFILVNTKEIQIYQINQQSDKSIGLDLITKNNIKIDDAQKLLSDNQSKYTINKSFNLLFVINFYVQAINQQTNETQYIINYFETNYVSHKSPITSLVATKNQFYLASCSKDGQIIIWQNINIFEGTQIFQYSDSKESCLQLLIFNDRYIIAQYISSFLVIDIFNPYDNPYNVNTLKIDEGKQTRNMTIFQNKCYLIQGAFLLVLNDKFEQEFKYTSDIISKTNNFFVTNDQLLILQTENQITLNQFDFKNQKLINLQQYSNTKIVLFLMRTLSNDNYIFALADYLFNIIILDSKLNIKQKQFVDQISSISDIQFPNNSDADTYFIVVMSKDTSLLNRQLIFKISFNETPIIESLSNRNPVSQITSSFIQNDLIGNSFYNLLAVYPISFTTAVGQFIVNKQTKELQNGLNMYSQGEKITKHIFSQSNNQLNQYVGAESGFVGYSHLYLQYLKEIFTSNNGNITQINQSLSLESIFIITQNVYILNIHTDQQQHEIKFTQNNNVISMVISEKLMQSMFYRGNEIAICDHISKEITFKNNLGQIKGTYFDENRELIYLIGDKFAAYSLKLDFKYIISNSTITFCVFTQDLAFCKSSGFILQSFDLKTLSQIFSQKIIGFTIDFFIQIDIIQNTIFLYYQTVQIYNFNGVFKTTLTQSTKSLIELNLYGNKLVLVSSSSIILQTNKNQRY